MMQGVKKKPLVFDSQRLGSPMTTGSTHAGVALIVYLRVDVPIRMST